mgnify:CR=1 FL=1
MFGIVAKVCRDDHEPKQATLQDRATRLWWPREESILVRSGRFIGVVV